MKVQNNTVTRYVVYILLCADGTYYTGVTTDLERRLAEHNGEVGSGAGGAWRGGGKASAPPGAKYTAARRPVSLVYQESAPDRSQAQKREYAIKKFTRAQKEILINCHPLRGSS